MSFLHQTNKNVTHKREKRKKNHYSIYYVSHFDWFNAKKKNLTSAKFCSIWKGSYKGSYKGEKIYKYNYKENKQFNQKKKKIN